MEQEIYNLKNELKLCRKYASKGYKIAEKQKDSINQTIEEAKLKIENTIELKRKSHIKESDVDAELERQFTEINSSFTKLSDVFNNDLKLLRKNLSKFSVTLFGETQTGKSTLMEILKEGNGESIGKGTQRTTRDVRKYVWNDLVITDVPGIGAYLGHEDEVKAFEAAKSADMILFLITDDGPGQVEAECFRRIIGLGKPVIGILNIKSYIDENDMDLTVADIEERFDKERLAAIKETFMKYGDSYAQDWHRIPFVDVHLHAAFCSQHADNKETADQLHELSRIEDLKRMIVEYVRSNGKYCRIKTFADAVACPALETEEFLLEESLHNSAQAKLIGSKSTGLAKWKSTFIDNGNTVIKSCYDEIRSNLYKDIPYFASNHYNDKEADQAWKTLIKSKKITKKGKETLEKLDMMADKKLEQTARQISQEMKYFSLSRSNANLQFKTYRDGGSLYRKSMSLISAVTGIGGLVSMVMTGPYTSLLMTASFISGMASGSKRDLFENSEKRKQRLQAEMSDKLKEHVDMICSDMQRQLEKGLNRIVQGKIDCVINEMADLTWAMKELSHTQKSLGRDLNNHLLELNRELLTEAIKLIDAEGLENWMINVARIPGSKVLIQCRNGYLFPKEQEEQLERLMSESIECVTLSQDSAVPAGRVLGESGDTGCIRTDTKRKIIRLILPAADYASVVRARLIQQLTDYTVTVQEG